MENVYIKTKIVDNFNETTKIETMGKFDRNENFISFYDNDVLVHIIIDDRIVMKRIHNDYNLDLIFDDQKDTFSTYEILNPKTRIEIEVKTTMLRRCNNDFYIEYILKMNNEEIGLFKVDFKMEV